jgi:L-lactate dehydrogenase complex protein LldG
MAADSDQRAAILGSIRRGLGRGPLPADQRAMIDGRIASHPRQLIPARTALDHPGLLRLFTELAEQQFTTIARIDSRESLPRAIAEYLRGLNLPMEAVIAPHPKLQPLDWTGETPLSVRFGHAGPEDVVSVQEGFAGIAETGTLMLPSGAATPTTLNLLPDTAIVALEADRVFGPYEDAFDLLRREQGGADGRFMPRNVMLVTGPSRSADIERTLELGAHGPRRLHVVLIGAPYADPPA